MARGPGGVRLRRRARGRGRAAGRDRAGHRPGRSSARLRATLDDWARADLRAARALALAYLPAGAALRATVYLMLKPRPNSFVMAVGTDSAAIVLHLDPSVSRAKWENTVAHELHHIGYAGACPDSAAPPPADASLGEALRWMSAFGEGVAVLAAAGGPERHPHAASDSAERARWERDLRNVPADLPRLEQFLLEVADGRLVDPDSIRRAGMSFFGDAQGPWYTVGYTMARAVERRLGRARLVASLCDPRRLLGAYQTAAGPEARWSDAFMARFGR